MAERIAQMAPMDTSSFAINRARQMFIDCKLNFEQQLIWYLSNAYVVSTPKTFMMFKEINASRGDDEWHVKDADCWYLHCVVGLNGMREFFKYEPYRLPLIAFRRFKSKANRLSVYNFNRLNNIIQ